MAHPFPNSFDADRFETRLQGLAQRDPFLFPDAVIPDDFRRSSILIGFWREAADLRVILTKRALTLSGHPGQMSFPGGKLEPGEAWHAAALRETEEEVGVPRQHIEVLGRLDDAWSGAGHLLVPIVGWLEEAPVFAPNPAEVESVHTPSVRHLMSPAAYSEEEVRVGHTTYQNKTLEWDGGSLFGLSTDLFIEAVQWATGVDATHGQVRLASLRSFLENRESFSAAATRSDRASDPGD